MRFPVLRHAHHARHLAPLLAMALVVAACGDQPASAPPSVAPTPVVTPNPHLADPATAQDVFNGLGRQGLKITPNTAVTGAGGAGVVTRINATYQGWPLDVTQYKTSADLAKAAAWTAGEAPGRGEPPVALAGYNILVRWGPWGTGTKPAVPEEQKAAALEVLVTALDHLISPLRTRTIVPVQVAVVAATPPPGPSSAPKATPAP
jgi:peptidoglycan hydrolase-like protein with peptidoglycan-binding domain